MSRFERRAGTWALMSYRDGNDRIRAGLLDASDEVHDLAMAVHRPEFGDPRAVLDAWSEALPLLEAFAVSSSRHADVGSLRSLALESPLPVAGSVFCAASNFRDHMLAMAAKLGLEPEADPHDRDVMPYHFLKPSRQCVVGPKVPVALPDYATRIDWEVELVAVIGRAARNVTVDQALFHVAGYTVGNDLSVRDHAYMKRPNVPDGSLFRTDFIGMKGFDGSCPIGPCIVPASALADPQSLRMGLDVDGEARQDSSTKAMVFTVAEQISHLSRYCTLLPGDLVLTGTPAGTGAESDTFLRAGQTVVAWIEGIGELETPIV